RRIQRATYLLSIEDGVTKRNKNGKVLGCGTHPNMESFHHPRRGLVEETQPLRNAEQDVAKVKVKYCHVHNW
ncbi:MAG: hypothetical protein U9N46_03360, partial [Euryarchaeota archaeon]|nr:hypothetical protein [Euryarchaeota archaeon]